METVVDELVQLLVMFPAPVLAGLAVGAVCSLLGVFVILKRVVFIGMTLSEVAACGIAAGLVLSVNPFVCACALTTLAVAALAYPFESGRIPRDAVLGVVFVLASAVGILLVSKSGFGLAEVKSLLYGDLILASWRDLAVVLAVLAPVAVYLFAFFRPTLCTFLDREMAKSMGLRVVIWEYGFFFALGLAVSAASKITGAILIFCYVVVAPSAALLLSKRLGVVMLLSATVACVSTLAGLYLSFTHDLPTNQVIAAVACVVFAGAACWRLVQSLRVPGNRKSETAPAVRGE